MHKKFKRLHLYPNEILLNANCSTLVRGLTSLLQGSFSRSETIPAFLSSQNGSEKVKCQIPWVFLEIGMVQLPSSLCDNFVKNLQELSLNSSWFLIRIFLYLQNWRWNKFTLLKWRTYYKLCLKTKFMKFLLAIKRLHKLLNIKKS